MLRHALFAGIFRNVMIVVTAAALTLGTATSFGMSALNDDHVHHALGHGHDHHHDGHDHDGGADESPSSLADSTHQDLGAPHVHVLTALPPDTDLTFADGGHVTSNARVPVLVTREPQRLDRPPKPLLA